MQIPKNLLKYFTFKMSFLGTGEPDEFLLFVLNFNTNLTGSGALKAGAKIQYIFSIVRGEALRQFDLLSADVEGTETLNFDDIIKGLAQYFLPVNSLSKEKRALLHRMKNHAL